ncbi:hypothetical protein BPNPMPFG_002499 [Mesorhizobium sp. AR07]|uniref:hypothetical protein n=1 Tax=Mesorhizobium sp. AR07 TaxID=2865838 RepID=UPI002160A0D2|nr:hypothetical protein [Mesorhizobium sp. AR07]UVK46789.1 hypothetical protein BPNPMPFG_002499 [Mesorhizobium sp. AR07]
MKLGELRGAIRKTKGNPFINVFPFPNTDQGFRMFLQKTPLLEELERVYPGGKAVETGLDFNVESGLLKSVAYNEYMGLTTEQKAAAFEGAATNQAAAPADDDDLLGDIPVLGVSPIAQQPDDDDLLV